MSRIERHSLRPLRRAAVSLILGGSLVSCTSTPTPIPSGSAPSAPPAAQALQDTSEHGPTRGGAPEANGRMELSLAEAVLLAMKNNPEFQVEQAAPAIQRTYEEEARAAFDPVLAASGSRLTADGFERSAAGVGTYTTDTSVAALSIESVLPTGTKIALTGRATLDESDSYAKAFDSTRGGLTISQSLLRGFGAGASLASLRQARLDTRLSEYEFRAFAASFAARVETTALDYVLAQKAVAIVADSVTIAQNQLAEITERIKVGKLAEIEQAAGQAELARRKEALINADNALATTRLNLLGLLNVRSTNRWDRELAVNAELDAAKVGPDTVLDHVAVAMKLRPDLNQARLSIEKAEIELVKTRNGQLPRMDVFITLGETGYADTFKGSLKDETGDGKDVSLGLNLEYPLGSRKDGAAHRRAVLSRQATADALENLENLVEIDIRSAYLEVVRAREQIAATRSTRQFQEATARGEEEKLRLGKSTALQVAQAQRDWVQSEVNEIRAVADYFKALVSLYRLDGSLLARRGLAAPGNEPAPSPTRE